MEQILDEYQHISRKTVQGAHRPTLKVWGWEHPTCHPTCTSQSASWTSSINGHHPFALDLQREGNMAQTGPTCSLHNCGCFPEHVWPFRFNILFQNLHPRNTQYYSHFEYVYICKKKTHFQNRIYHEIRKEWGRTNYEIHRFLAQGKCLLSLSLIHTSCHFRRNGCQTGAVNTTFQWSAANFTAILQESHQ